ncbi:MAG: hypothetical protein ACREDE_04335 [Thermoplasmata archaeon]
MIERPVAFTLLGLPFVWVFALLLPIFPRAAWPLVLLGWGACLGLAAAWTLRPSYLGPWGWGILAVLFLLAAVVGLSSSFGANLAVGVMLGVPWIAVGYAARPSGALGVRFFGYGVALVAGLVLLATPGQVSATTGTVSAGDFLSGWLTVAFDQTQVLGGLVTGAATPAIPLNGFFDPVYAALAAGAVLGLMLVSVRPQTGRGAPLPIAIRTSRNSDAGRVLDPAYGFTAIQRAVFLERSSVEPPLTAWPPGLPSVLCGALAASVFLAASYLSPLWTVLASTIATAVVVLFLIVVVEVPGFLRVPSRPRLRRPRRSATATPPRAPGVLTQPSPPAPDPPSAPSSAPR